MEREERIFVTYMAVPLRGNKGPNVGYHASLNYIDKNGRHYVVEAEPAGYDDLPTIANKAGAFLDEELFSSGPRNKDSRFGRMVARERSVKPQDLERPFENIYEAEDLSREWNAIRATVRMVNERGYEYRPLSQNSNTFAFAALRAAGLNASGTGYDRRTGKSNYHVLRGRDFELSNPINEDGVPEKAEYENSDFVEGRIRELQGLMGDLRSEYFHGPKAGDLQAEFRSSSARGAN